MVEGELVEVNLYGEAIKDGKKIVVVGEVKSRIYDKDVKRFIKTLEKIESSLKDREILPLMFGFLIHPSAQQKAKEKKIRLIASYQR